jgi:hypothetical protein
MMATKANIRSLYERAAAQVERAGVFAGVAVRADRLACQARGSAAPAEFRLELDGGRLWVVLVTPDRWLSESIEADLMHTGDDLEELIEEEIADQGLAIGRLPFEHFRSEDKLFTFRSPLPIDPPAFETDAAADIAARSLLAYEACFRNLGDMSAGEEA